jgi:hypothetical protein
MFFHVKLGSVIRRDLKVSRRPSAADNLTAKEAQLRAQLGGIEQLAVGPQPGISGAARPNPAPQPAPIPAHSRPDDEDLEEEEEDDDDDDDEEEDDDIEVDDEEGGELVEDDSSAD